jgi:hypothetical protein
MLSLKQATAGESLSSLITVNRIYFQLYSVKGNRKDRIETKKEAAGRRAHNLLYSFKLRVSL